jgi:hypothetical protein
MTASSLASPINWAPLATNHTDVNGVFNFTDPQATNYLLRFYRVTVP